MDSFCVHCGKNFPFKNGKLFCSRYCKEQSRADRSAERTFEKREAARVVKLSLSLARRTSRQARRISMERHYRIKFGLNLEQVEELRKNHNGLCDICGTSDPRGNFKKFHIDHVKGTQIIRGMLCNNCNMGIGFMRHDVDILRKAADYLEKFKT